ncbi:MAG: chorismate synthase [Clostridia bacterium]|nr:chorismate synthase [Clostridia bacterium]
MKNTFGNNISLTLFGESHGDAIGCVIDGLPAGVEVSGDDIAHALDLRRPSGKISTSRVEHDEFKILSGVFNGKTTGTPICICIPNADTRSKDYTPSIIRPGHADFTAYEKYHGFQDYRGGGHFSGRLTAPLVCAGAIIAGSLKKKGIYIGTHLLRCADESDRAFENYEDDIERLSSISFPVLDEAAGEKMKAEIEKAKLEGDSVGGVLETCVIGLPTGLGEPWFDTVEGVLSHALFSIPAIKGVEFGLGFALSDMRGSEANDAFCVGGGKIQTRTNNCGGILGGITDGMPLIIRTAVKPTPTINKSQQTVDYLKREQTEISSVGRHDPCVAHRARAAVDAVTALVIADLYAARYGTEGLISEEHE